MNAELQAMMVEIQLLSPRSKERLLQQAQILEDDGYLTAANCIRACANAREITNPTSNTVAFDRLPRGARFKYVGHSHVYVKLGHGDDQCGFIAVWDNAQLDWPGQQLFSLCDTPGERATCLVEWLDQQ